MAVTLSTDPLLPIGIQEPISKDRMLEIMQRLSSTYEWLWGVPAPGRSSLSQIPHDHSMRGGGCILPRYRQFSFLGPQASETTIGATVIKPNTVIQIPFIYRSTEGLAPVAGEARLCIRVTPGKKVEIKENGTIPWTPYTGREPDEYEWVSVPVTRPVDTCIFIVRSLEPDDVEFRIQGAVITEKYEQADYRGDIDVLAVSGTLSSRALFLPLNDAFVTHASNRHYWLDTFLLHTIAGYANGLYEGTFDQNRPGHSNQEVRGHNHTSGRGGAPVARGGVYSAYRGFGKWIALRSDYVQDTWATVSPTRAWQLYPYISRGVVTTGSLPNYTSLSATVDLRVAVDGLANIEVRVYNGTTTTQSQIITSPPVSAGGLAVRRITVPRVPVQEGMNKLRIVARMLDATTTQMTVLQADIYEHPGETYLP